MNNTNSLLNKAQTQLRELIKTLYNELRAEDLDTAKTFNEDIDMLIILLKKLEEECKENKYNKAERKAERYKILLINALILLEENGFGGENFAINEIGITSKEYREIMGEPEQEEEE